MELSVVMTQGVKESGCRDWDLAIALLFQLYRQREEFIVFKNVVTTRLLRTGMIITW
ncbi:hypothetical protein ACFSL6_27265 [Paenibacillus thailandensis]|uniref:hypothetical protein n=1 Tax=Paenibacillus thailandensis TaxID=393250 RepID=UPI0036351723